MSKKKIPPFKMIPVELREHLHELTGNEFKVLMCLYLHSDTNGEAYPSNSLIVQETGLTKKTVKAVKASLRKKELITSKQRYRDNGSLSTMSEKIALPRCKNFAYIGEESTPTSVKNLPLPSVQTLHLPEVDTLEVDTGKPDTSKPQGQKQVSQSVRKSALDASHQVVPDRNLVKLYYPIERELFAAIKPINQIGDHVTVEERDAIESVLTLCNEVDICPFDLLRFNRAHKSRSLHIRTPQQYAAAVKSTDQGDYFLLNAYKTHNFARCNVCYPQNIKGTHNSVVCSCEKAEPLAQAAVAGFEHEGNE